MATNQHAALNPAFLAPRQCSATHDGFTSAVVTSNIDAKENLVGFQGDITFDERVITFASPPVEKTGLTAGNWNVSGNVLDGPGPIRTLRISAYANDTTPLSGSGPFFQLNMVPSENRSSLTPLIWAAPPNNFIFIGADLRMRAPESSPSGSATRTGIQK